MKIFEPSSMYKSVKHFLINVFMFTVLLELFYLAAEGRKITLQTFILKLFIALVIFYLGHLLFVSYEKKKQN